MFSGIQKLFKIIGTNGCYFLSIVYTFNKNADILSTAKLAVDNKWVGNDLFVILPQKLAGYLSGIPLTVTETDKDYVPKDNEKEILCGSVNGIEHFRTCDFDPMAYTNAFVLESKRIFNKI